MCPLEAAMTSQIFQIKLNFFAFKIVIRLRKILWTMKISPLDAAGCLNLQWSFAVFCIAGFKCSVLYCRISRRILSVILT